MVAVDRHGTISAAARSLFITQSAASQQLRQADLDRRAEVAPIELVRTCDGHGLKSVLDGRVHAAIVPSGQQAGSHESRHLFDDELVAVVSTQSDLANRITVTPDDLRETRYVSFGTTPEDPHNVTVDNILRLESTQAIVNIVATTDRVSILSRWGVPADRGVVAIPLEPRPPAISWSLATGDLGNDSPIAATADHLVDHMNRTAADERQRRGGGPGSPLSPRPSTTTRSSSAS